MAAPAFLCDGMLGHVTRWLRLLGFDAEYAGSDVDDDELLHRAAASGRVLATRDVALHARAHRRGLSCVRLAGGTLEEELVELLRGAHVDPGAMQPLTRCTECNGILVAVETGTIAAGVPPGVLDRNPAFQRCPACGHVYWEGTHVREIQARVERLRNRFSAAEQSS